MAVVTTSPATGTSTKDFAHEASPNTRRKPGVGDFVHGSTPNNFRFPASSATSPSAMAFNNGPWNGTSSKSMSSGTLADPFKVSPEKGSDKFRLSANVPAFQPTASPRSSPRPMQSLNNGSIPERRIIVESPPVNLVGKTPKFAIVPYAIGSGSPTSSSGSTTPTLEGPPFTTDSDPNFAKTRFIIVKDIPEALMERNWLDQKEIDRVVTELEAQGTKVRSYTTSPRNGTVDLYLFFDDLRDAETAPAYFKKPFKNSGSEHVTAHRYFEADCKNPGARSISAFDGQVEFVATFRGKTMDFDAATIRSNVRTHAEKFGKLRTFAVQDTSEMPNLHFRVEYFKLSAAEKAVATGAGGKLGEVGKDVLVHAREYLPANYRRYPHSAASPQRPSNEPLDTKAAEAMGELMLSPTKRTAWVNGQPIPQSQVSPPVRQDASYPRPPAGYAYSPDTSAVPRASRSRYTSMAPQTPTTVWLNQQMDGPRDFYSPSHGRSGGRRRDDDLNQPQHVHIENIESGRDVRTTIMLRNVPNRMAHDQLKVIIDQSSRGHYDFSYLRIDFGNNCNVGYAFVNFVRPELIIPFMEARVGKPWDIEIPDKLAEVSYATIQGQDCLIQKFRNSSVMQEYAGFRPKVYYTIDSDDIPPGSKPGDEKPFPAPDNPSKLQRSIDNAMTQGLYGPRNGMQSRDERRRRSQFDRGTPRAIMEEAHFDQLSPVSQRHSTPRMLMGPSPTAYSPSRMMSPMRHGAIQPPVPYSPGGFGYQQSNVAPFPEGFYQ